MSRQSRKSHVQFEVYKSKVELEIIKRLGPGEMGTNIRKAWRIVKDSEELTRLAWEAGKPPLFVAEALTFDMPVSSSAKRSTTKRSKAKRSTKKRRTARRLLHLRKATKKRGHGILRHLPMKIHRPIRYEVVESKRWVNTRTGRTASPYGAVPWTSDAEKHEWQLQNVGWTVYDRNLGTYGIGRVPWATRSEAQAAADKMNDR